MCLKNKIEHLLMVVVCLRGVRRAREKGDKSNGVAGGKLGVGRHCAMKKGSNKIFEERIRVITNLEMFRNRLLSVVGHRRRSLCNSSSNKKISDVISFLEPG